MRISVITPVYNAADFVREAVESALAQPEVAEVILVEDASTDNSLTVCETLAAEDARVRLYRHRDGANRGAGASRNLAIQKSTCPYIAFLDADDFYLPGRFTVAAQRLDENPDLDGVYEAIGAHFQSEAVRAQWLDSQNEETFLHGDFALTTVTQNVPPDALFETLVSGGMGYFHGDGLLVKRTVFDRTGWFDEHLRLHQDKAMWLKMAAVSRLAGGRLEEPVAMRRVHAHNRITASRSAADVNRTLALMWETVWLWSYRNLPAPRHQLVLKAYLRIVLKPCLDDPVAWRRVGCSYSRLIRLLLRHPAMSRQRPFWRTFSRRFRVGMMRRDAS
jgi:glycosyltransferase involved in cell wall biosynthesis